MCGFMILVCEYDGPEDDANKGNEMEFDGQKEGHVNCVSEKNTANKT